MCTVTWLSTPGRYQVFFNRDEKRTRDAARPPLVHQTNGVKVLAPIDGNAGGAWLAANEYGLTLGLLNHYPAEKMSSGHISRGLLLMILMNSRTRDEVTDRLNSGTLADYKPFFLVAFEPGVAPCRNLWDGERLDSRILNDEDLPLTTSSFEAAAVVAARRRTFDAYRTGLTAEKLQQFHAGGHEQGGAYGVFMHRPDAETVSFSCVTVAPDRIDFYYAPRVPGSLDFPQGREYTLARG